MTFYTIIIMFFLKFKIHKRLQI